MKTLQVKKEGRPTVLTEETIGKLESVFKLAVTDAVACNYAGINPDTFYSHIKSDPIFSERITSAKNYARLAAGNVVMDSIVKQKDVEAAKWWLERKYKNEFGNQQEQVPVAIQINFGSPEIAEWGK